MATSASPVSTALQATAKGTVVFVQGEAYLRDSSGKLTAIKPGDVVAEGDAIVTAAGAIVELQLPSGAKLSVGPERELLLNDELFATATPERSENIVSSLGADADKVIQALNGGADPFDSLEEPAAGITGGGLGDQTHDFVRLVRILEEVTPVSYAYSSTADGIDFLPVAGATTTPLVPANTPPVANTDATVAATEDNPVSINVLGNDTDADGDPLAVTGASVDPAKGSVTVNPDGTLTFTPAANVNGPVEITYTISDGKGGTSSATTTVDIAPVADAATVGAGSGTVKENTPAQNVASGTVSIVDPDAGEAAFQPQTNSAGTYGSFTLAADGAWTYTLDNTKPEVRSLKEGQRSTETFTVTSIDGTTSTVTITVIGTNDAPVAVADNASTDEDQPVTLRPLANDTDPDADTLAVTNASAANGQVTINPDGTLRYVPDPDFNGTDTVTYTISDGNGGTSTTTVTINVAPAPDAPVAVADLAATNEEQPVTFTVLDNDTDADGDTLTVTGASVDAAKGTVVVNTDGTLTFAPAANVNGPVQITYTISDGKGGTSSAIATVDIAPVNDPASISQGAGTVQEETTLLASGTLTVTDPDADQSAFQAQSGTPGTYGSFSIDAAGHWTYTLDNGNPLVQGLATGDTRSETFTVASLDGTESTVVVTVLGLNEVIGAPGVGIVKEDNPIQTGGQLTASGGASFVAQPSTPGSYGSLTLNPDGSWTYTLANPTDAVQSLRDGEIRTETFPVSLSDGTTSTITITVVGTNDPAIVSRDSGMVTEDSAPTTNGVLTVSDADAGESAFRPQVAVAGQYGSFSIDAAGNWTYTLDSTHPAVQALGLGDTLSETFPVATVDGTPSRVAITINGTNDAPVVTPDSKVTPEDQPISGALTATDPDGDPLNFALKDAPTNGSVTVKPDGTYTYTPNRDYNGPDSFTVTVSDGKGGSVVTTVSLTVTPLNDNPVARNDANGLVKTDTVPATGNLITNPAGADTDVDGDTLAVSNVAGVAVTGATVVTGLYGTLTIQANGQYSYIPDATNNTVTSLAPGATLQDAFTYTVTDGQGGSANAVLSITIAGANTPPVARADVVGTPEDSAVKFAVLGNDTDPENDTLSVTGASVDSAKGTVVVNLDGTLTFTPAANVNGPVEVTYTISDGKGGTSTAIATVNIAPTADTAVLGTGAGAVKEDTPTQTTASGTLSIVDPDAGEAAFQPQTNSAGTYGSFTLATDGAWTYTLDNTKPEVQALKEGETRPETFTVTSVDGTTTTVSITVTGTNDGPTARADSATGTEDQPVTFAVLGNDTDPDGDTLSVTGASVDPLKGSILVNADGTLTFTPAANVNGPVEITYTISDGKGGTSTAIATINVTPTADTAVLGTGAGAVKEDTPTQTTASGTLSIVDPDAGEAAFRPQTDVPGLYGTLTLAADGAWTYTLDNTKPEVQALKEGETRPETFTVTSIDGTTTTMSITVTGTNDGPTARADSATGIEDQPVTFAVLGNDTDLDGDTLTVTGATVDPLKGTVVVNANGTLTFTPAANVNGPVEVTYTISDGKGGTSTAIATINVAPQNDAPVAANDTASTTEDSAVTRNANQGVLANDSDMDSTGLSVAGARTGTSGTFAPVDGTGLTLTGNYGSLLIRADGSYTYTPGAAAQALNTGDMVQEVFSYQMTDGQLGSTATLTISISGANDAAQITGTLIGTVKEDIAGQLVTGGSLAATDVDSPAGFTPASAGGTYGSFSIAANGTWTYTLNNDSAQVQALREGDVRTETFQVATTDGTTRNITVTVLGTNELPTVTPATATGTEDPAAPIPVTLTGADIDGTVVSLTLADLPAHGTLYLDAAMTRPVVAGTTLPTGTGSLTLYFQPDANWNGNTAFHFTASDNNGGISAPGTASIGITAVNDAPLAANDFGAVNEDATLNVSAANGLITSTATPAGADRDIDGDTLAISAIRTGAESASGTTGTVGTAITGSYGTLTVQADGSYTYVANHADALAAGVTATDVFTYTVSDGSKTDTAELVITLTGTNDTPVISGGVAGAVTEDITLSTSGTLVINDADAGQSSFVAETVTGSYGSLKLESNGSWVYTLNNSAPNVQGLKQGEQVIERIPVTTADGTVTMVSITVTGTNDAPLVGSASVNVSEEGLTGGIADSAGNTDSTDLTVASGTLSLSDADGNTLVASLTAPVASLSSGGVPITWNGSGTQTLIGSANGVEILRATIASDGSYTVKLSGPVDHPDTTGEDVRSIALGVNVSDGVTTSTSTLTVNVEDDSPIAAAASQTITVAPVDTNLLLMLDNSASMTRTDGVAGTSRLASAISALNTLLDRYDGFGEVRVRLVTFNSEAVAVGGTWTTVAQAKAQLAAIVATGGTNYDAAIAAGQSAYSSTGKLASGQNIAYFLSDGQPNTGTAIGAGDEAAWKGFLQSNQITSFALGMGTGASQAPLDPIAYNGATSTNLDGQVISDFNQLSTALQATVPQPANGELLSGGLLGGTSGFGADGGSIRSVTVDGVTYNYNPAGSGSVTVSGGTSHGSYNATSHQLTVATAAGGTLAVNLSTGSYTYTPISTISSKVTDGFSFVLADKDGDTGSSSVTFDVSRLAENNIVLSSTTSAIAKASLGLTGEYYGYNETSNTTSTRFHADDKTLGNLDHVSDMTKIVDGRSGQTIVGTYNAATATGADATFSADKIDYGFGYTTGTTSAGAVDGNLGNNPTLLGSNLAINSGALYNFLRGGTTGSDSSELKTTTGIGNTTDSGMRMVGLVNLGGGIYDIRVTADDGFRLNIAGQTVAMFDNIQSPTARTYTNVSLATGLQPIEILYWEQGGNARLRIEVKMSGEPDTGYKTLGTDEFALFTPTSAPTLNALQDIIEDPTQNGQWLIRTGSQLAGSNGNDDITGSDGRDDISGGDGNDIIRAGTGADLISGGAGNDTLTGGLGSDTFKWSLADTVTTTKPAVDAITDFNTASAINGGDVLDLHDLLQGESQASGNLGNYLHFEKAGADTVVHVSSTGGYTGGTFVAGATDQKIVLQGVDLTNSGALSSDTQIIQDLLLKGKLHTD